MSATSRASFALLFKLTMAHLLSKGKEQVVEALEKATAAMSVEDQNKQAPEQPKSESSQQGM